MSKVQDVKGISVEGTQSSVRTQKLVITAIFIALTFVITTYINIRIPFLPANGGLVHLGNVPVFFAAVVFGKRTGALVGAIGLGLFDLLNGWIAWAPFTFVICGLIGYVYGWVVEKNKNMIFQIVAVLSAVFIKVVGYYLAEGIIYANWLKEGITYKNWLIPAASIPGNVVQIIVAGVIVIPLTAAVCKVLPNVENN